MKKTANIFILTVLDICIAILPPTLTYFRGGLRGTIFIDSIPYTQTYVDFILSKLTEASMLTYYFLPFSLISMSIINLLYIEKMNLNQSFVK